MPSTFDWLLLHVILVLFTSITHHSHSVHFNWTSRSFCLLLLQVTIVKFTSLARPSRFVHFYCTSLQFGSLLLHFILIRFTSLARHSISVHFNSRSLTFSSLQLHVTLVPITSLECHSHFVHFCYTSLTLGSLSLHFTLIPFTSIACHSLIRFTSLACQSLVQFTSLARHSHSFQFFCMSFSFVHFYCILLLFCSFQWHVSHVLFILIMRFSSRSFRSLTPVLKKPSGCDWSIYNSISTHLVLFYTLKLWNPIHCPIIFSFLSSSFITSFLSKCFNQIGTILKQIYFTHFYIISFMYDTALSSWYCRYLQSFAKSGR